MSEPLFQVRPLIGGHDDEWEDCSPETASHFGIGCESDDSDEPIVVVEDQLEAEEAVERLNRIFERLKP